MVSAAGDGVCCWRGRGLDLKGGRGEGELGLQGIREKVLERSRKEHTKSGTSRKTIHVTKFLKFLN